MALTARILERASELGFDLVSVAPAVRLPHAEHFARWLELERHGEMAYMARHQEKRVDPKLLYPPTETIISVAMLYHVPDDGPIARYARSLDYHDVIRSRLKKLGAFVQAEAGVEVEARRFIDSAPLLERDVALLAGLGWLGKSACVIHQGLGSYLLFGELCLSLDLEVATTPHPDRCGTCTRCIDACPTDAIVAPYEIDARRCISYLTIELRGPIPRDLRAAIGGHLFGCDICQSVCPWNHKAPLTPHDVFRPDPELQNLSLIDLLDLDEASFRARFFKRSPLYRATRDGLLRNACVVLGNSHRRDAVPRLARALQEDHAPLVRGHAAWALGQLGGDAARSALDRAHTREDDDYVLEEVRFALSIQP